MKKLNKRIAIISGSRGDYDLLKPIIKRMYVAKNIKDMVQEDGYLPKERINIS